MRTTTGLRLGAAAAGATLALAVLPGGANAAFDAAHGSACANAGTIKGKGASFQTLAQIAWGTDQVDSNTLTAGPQGFGYATSAEGGCTQFKIAAEGGTRKVTYDPNGSGAGRRAFGASTTAGQSGVRDTTIHYGGADEAPSSAELTAANAGPNAGATDDAQLLTIPVAQSSVAVLYNLPAGCTLPAADRKASRVQLEGAWSSSASFRTWGEITGNKIAGAGCAAKLVKRVVRFDSSGTTFAFKGYLRTINEPTWGLTGNTEWPNNAGDQAVLKAASNGVNAQLDTLNAQTTDGGIAYGDLASARAKGYDDGGEADTKFWVDVETKVPGDYRSPAVNDTPAAAGAQRGSNCLTVGYTDPAVAGLPATGASWFSVNGASATADYAICALTYGLAWDDMARINAGKPVDKPDYNQDQARAVKDYLGYTLNGGQAKLAAAGYQALPAPVLTAAKASLARVTWNGQPVPVTPVPDPVDPGTPTPTVPVVPTVPTVPVVPTVPTVPVVPTPKPAPVAKPKVALAAKGTAVKGRKVTLTITPSAAGRVSVSGTVRSGGKTVSAFTGSGTATKSGTLKVTVKPTSKGKKALKAGKKAKITFKVTFTTADGTKATVTRTITVKLKK